jgi:hypothetical protein
MGGSGLDNLLFHILVESAFIESFQPGIAFGFTLFQPLIECGIVLFMDPFSDFLALFLERIQ